MTGMTALQNRVHGNPHRTRGRSSIHCSRVMLVSMYLSYFTASLSLNVLPSSFNKKKIVIHQKIKINK